MVINFPIDILLLGYIAYNKLHTKQNLANIFDWGRDYTVDREIFMLKIILVKNSDFRSSFDLQNFNG